MASLAVSKTTAVPGESITVTFSGAPATSNLDWIGQFPASAPDSTWASHPWQYLNGVANGTRTFTLPSTEGSYEYRLFPNDSLTRIATSPTVIVSVAPPPPPAETIVNIPAGKTKLIYRFE